LNSEIGKLKEKLTYFNRFANKIFFASFNVSFY
jgi:hypothetical protein